MQSRGLIVFLLILLAVPSVLAKHGRPPAIQPIVRDGVRYVVPNDKGRHAYVEAWDATTSKRIWTATVFHRIYVPCPWLGTECMYFEYIRSMELEGGCLILTSERDRRFSLDIRTRSVRRLKTKDPNQAAAGKAAGALSFQFETPCRGLPEPRRWAQRRVVCVR
jgi:hypothetical protein